MKNLISIIIPVYNCERYIRKCLNSLLNQTYKSIEIIVVNDGSTDNSLGVLEEFEKLDNRIILINQINQGVSAARNRGIQEARGEYVAFVDGDDWVENNMYELLLGVVREAKAKMVLCNFFVDFPNGNKIKNKLPWTNTSLLEKNSIKEELIPAFLGRSSENSNDQIVFGSVCRCLYKKDVIDKELLRFSTTIHYTEDLLFNLNYIKNIDQVALCDSYLYHYYYNSESSTKSYIPKMLESNINTFKQIEIIIQELNSFKNYDSYISWRWRSITVDSIINVARYGNNKKFRDKLKEINELMSLKEVRYSFEEADFSILKIKYKVIYFLILYKLSIPLYIYYKIAIKWNKTR